MAHVNDKQGRRKLEIQAFNEPEQIKYGIKELYKRRTALETFRRSPK